MSANLCLFVALVLATAFPFGVRADQSVGGTDDKGGAITGVVKFDGAKPAVKVLVGPGALCAKPLAAPIVSERVILGKNDELKNVLVQVVKGPAIAGKKFKAPDKPLLIDQVDCVYIPHVSAAVAGQKVQFRNSDATLHNVHTLPKDNPEENFGQPVKGMISDVKLKKAELGVFVKCDVHAWMSCYVHILPHPFFAITDADGKFTIKGLPPGDYELLVWHEVKRFAAKQDASLKVTVKDGAATETEIVMWPKPVEEK